MQDGCRQLKAAILTYGNSSVGRALVSKTSCREFEPLFPCQSVRIMFKSIVQYCKDSYDELVHKVTWPSLKELTNTALIVLYASIIIALIVFAMDFVFEKFMGLVYSLFR